MSTGLGEAFTKIRADSQLAQQFVKDPQAVMAQLGVDTTNLKVTKEAATNAAAGTAQISGCVSIGCIVCASIG